MRRFSTFLGFTFTKELQNPHNCCCYQVELIRIYSEAMTVTQTINSGGLPSLRLTGVVTVTKKGVYFMK